MPRRSGVKGVDPLVDDGPFKCQPGQSSIFTWWNFGSRPGPHRHRCRDRKPVPRLTCVDDLVQAGVGDDDDGQVGTGLQTSEDARPDVVAARWSSTLRHGPVPTCDRDASA